MTLIKIEGAERFMIVDEGWREENAQDRFEIEIDIEKLEGQDQWTKIAEHTSK